MYVRNMDTFSDIIEAFGGYKAFAEAIGITASHAGVMKFRNSIPAVYWKTLVEAARSRRIRGVTLEKLADLESKKAA